MAWDWFIVDLSYVLVLVGGGMVFRANPRTSVFTWLAFAFISVLVGTVLFFYTYDASTALATSSGSESEIVAALSC